MTKFYVARPLDPVPATPGDLFRVRILSVYTLVDQANVNVVRRKNMGENDVIIITDKWESRVEPRRPRQIITAKVGPGTPGSFRFETWA